ncbi:epithelial membrane protein 3 [Esox lucius]|uniref:Epithelial membrane protein 3b n=1 Tax=Esox lucius TaxID=8010 RepID=A0A3P8Z7K9_ESOLU|nr:epithelial membrane protein 3 [Esox lucius]XP_010880327.1 epithelial membrane protein 3 [Esox lucius]
MVVLLISVTVLHLVTLAMLLIAIMEKSWWVWDDTEIRNLWYNCIHDNRTGNWLCAASDENDWLQAVQALMVLSVVFSSVSFMAFLGHLFTMSKGGVFYFSGLCQAVTGFTSFAACLIFTFHCKEILGDTRDLRIGHFGYCFILAWSSVPLLLFSGVVYVHLRKSPK